MPEQNAVVVVDLAAGQLVQKILLETGDEPGRLVDDGSGRVHVALRGGGAVLSLSPESGAILARRAVCGAPRGIALTGVDELTVACSDGKLVSLPASGGAVTRSLTLGADLRDVLPSENGLVVSRFKSAELLRLDATGNVARVDRPSVAMGNRLVLPKAPANSRAPSSGPGLESVPFLPLVAWRAIEGPSGSTVVVHQRAVDGEIELDVDASSGGSAYGGSGFDCAGISQNAVSVIGADGSTSQATFGGPPLPVDAILLPDRQTLLVAHAGSPDPAAPRPFTVFVGEEGSGAAGQAPVADRGFPGQFGDIITALRLPSADGSATPGGQDVPGCTNQVVLPVAGSPVAIAKNPGKPSQVVVQTRNPSGLIVLELDGATLEANLRAGGTFVESPESRVVPFDDLSTRDTGYELFHRDAGGGIACASCHPEATEDGNVWRFSGLGARRTQALDAALAETAPFHWDGDLANVRAIMSEVFVNRMGGVLQSEERLRVLESWLFAREARSALRAFDDPAVLRGKALFESASTECVTCHSGTQFTNNRSVDVGTGRAFQVPSLIGIGYRAPFMHTGCARTLAERFTNPACGGGELHGKTAHLGSDQIADLVAYLESL